MRNRLGGCQANTTSTANVEVIPGRRSVPISAGVIDGGVIDIDVVAPFTDSSSSRLPFPCFACCKRMLFAIKRRGVNCGVVAAVRLSVSLSLSVEQ